MIALILTVLQMCVFVVFVVVFVLSIYFSLIFNRHHTLSVELKALPGKI